MNARTAMQPTSRERRPASWSPSFHGVTHLAGLKPGIQITVTDRGNGAEAILLTRATGFTPAQETKQVDVAAAKSWGEEMADKLGLLGGA